MMTVTQNDFYCGINAYLMSLATDYILLFSPCIRMNVTAVPLCMATCFISKIIFINAPSRFNLRRFALKSNLMTEAT